MGFKRVINRTYEEIRATRFIAKETSFYEALITFIAKIDIQIISRNGYKEKPRHKRHLLKKHDIMIKYFKSIFKDYLESYVVKKESHPNENFNDVIWMCWWQGEENAPEIVKKCIESVRRNAGSKKLIVINENNYKDYIQVPEWIEEKKNRGIITRTHFSDLYRLYLLATYGGMWLDATFYCCGNLEKYFDYPLWSIKRPDYLHASIASGYFATYSLQCSQNKKWIFKVVLDFYLHYWKISERQIDYLTLDYMFVLAQMIDEDIKNEFASVPSNNPNCDELFKCINETFDQEKWNNLQEDTDLFKLSWKIKLKDQNTFYKNIFKNNE